MQGDAWVAARCSVAPWSSSLTMVRAWLGVGGGVGVGVGVGRRLEVGVKGCAFSPIGERTSEPIAAKRPRSTCPCSLRRLPSTSHLPLR